MNKKQKLKQLNKYYMNQLIKIKNDKKITKTYNMMKIETETYNELKSIQNIYKLSSLTKTINKLLHPEAKQ